MKQRFVADENVIIGAAQGKNERGEDDLSFEMLLKEMMDNCHRLVVDLDLHERYHRQINVQRLGFPNILKAFITNSEKYDFREPGKSLEEEGQFHWKDAPLVRLAVANQAIFVTTDDDLIKELRQASLTNKYELTVVRPEEALTFAGPTEE